jgi:hypothetical protein
MIVMRSRRLIGGEGRLCSDYWVLFFDKRFEYGQMKRLWCCLLSRCVRVGISCLWYCLLEESWNVAKFLGSHYAVY